MCHPKVAYKILHLLHNTDSDLWQEMFKATQFKSSTRELWWDVPNRRIVVWLLHWKANQIFQIKSSQMAWIQTVFLKIWRYLKNRCNARSRLIIFSNVSLKIAWIVAGMNVTLNKPRFLPPPTRLQKESSEEPRNLVIASSVSKTRVCQPMTLRAYLRNPTLTTWCKMVESNNNPMRQWFVHRISRGTGALTRLLCSRDSSRMGRQRIYKCVKQSIIFLPLLHYRKILILRWSMWLL